MLPIDHAPPNLSDEQASAYRHLREAYVGPESGTEEILSTIPSLQYVLGMLFPPEDRSPTVETTADVEEGDVEEEELEPLAEEWRPSSAAISFVTDAGAVEVGLDFGTYRPFITAGTDDDKARWKRTPARIQNVTFTAAQMDPVVKLIDGIEVELGCRWRNHGEYKLVTVHARNRSVVGESSTASESRTSNARHTMYQVDLTVKTVGGSLQNYDRGRNIDSDLESEELRLRYRKRRTLAVGHGLAARWSTSDSQPRTVAWLDSMPAHVVRDVIGREYKPGHPAQNALSIESLASLVDNPSPVLASLHAFVDDFSDWVNSEQRSIASFAGRDQPIASRIVERAGTSVRRMREGIDVLSKEDSESQVRRAFSLAMEAMAKQMRQIAQAKKPEETPESPMWRPFQLGFLLTSIASTIDSRHSDREVVDLIWFPTGGGKTEAYLGLAAMEMFLRRLKFGSRGAGTAVITRYTLRLLTSQQFQRSASLICAMELLRRTHSFLRGTPEFTIGLWVGNDVTPGSRKAALEDYARLLEAQNPADANKFQLTDCPWCLTPLLPANREDDPLLYGVSETAGRVHLRCVSSECPFSDELPVLVTDEDIFDYPPSFLLGTVDKFAQLQFRPEAGRILGIGTVFRQPSLLIQDELHLLSGPLGTTVGAFEAAIQVLLSQYGESPKIIASTATIRASDKQIEGLYGRSVALYPPAGLDENASYFSHEDTEGNGRLFIGAMPQSLPQATALVAIASPLFELPQATTPRGSTVDAYDKYWTTVLYHNSLRELGRTNTLLTDDVTSRIGARALRLDLNPRSLSSSQIVELTSRKSSTELRADLGRLEKSRTNPDAVDAVLSSNMLSVGIDVPRLALMLMVGQPKTTSEYIQATSRVGRGSTKGIVLSLFRANRARDRSHFETFQSFHEALYRSVEPTSVTPWSDSSRRKSLPGVILALARQGVPSLSANDSARQFRAAGATGSALAHLLEELLERVAAADARELESTQRHIRRLTGQWDQLASTLGPPLVYRRRRFSRKDAARTLTRDFAEPGEAWVVANSMRSVDPTIAVSIREPFVREAESD